MAGLLACAVTQATPAKAGPQPVVEESFVVALDAGHGGDNEGCVAWDHEAHEKDVTLALALELRAALRRRLPHAQVVLTREDDASLALAQRVAKANESKADLFLSLHANASPRRDQTGFETYILDARASTLEAARTARRENDEGLSEPTASGSMPEVAAMLRQLEMTAQRATAARFAMEIQREQAQRFPERLDRGVKQAPFDVLMGARMPAVLFEAGFLDHPQEGALLRDPKRRAEIVDGLVDAIVEQYRLHARAR